MILRRGTLRGQAFRGYLGAGVSIPPLEAVVFAFNRGRLVRNCVLSIRRFMPDVPVTVFDDRSTDRETCEILEGLGRDRGISILTAPDRGASENQDATFGGLYRNMQRFIDIHARSPWALLLQDDTQIVRPVTSADLARLEQIATAYPAAAFVHPAFLTYRELYDQVDPASFVQDEPSYTLRPEYEFSGYFDVCIAKVDRLRAVRFRFTNELGTSISARATFGPMRLMRAPFVGHLPSPPTWRTAGRTWTQRIWEQSRAGVFPIDPLGDANIQRLQSFLNAAPTAEAFLTSTTFPAPHPWPYSTLEGAPVPVQFLNRIEHGLRRRLRRAPTPPSPGGPAEIG